MEINKIIDVTEVRRGDKIKVAMSLPDVVATHTGIVDEIITGFDGTVCEILTEAKSGLYYGPINHNEKCVITLLERYYPIELLIPGNTIRVEFKSGTVMNMYIEEVHLASRICKCYVEGYEISYFWPQNDDIVSMKRVS